MKCSFRACDAQAEYRVGSDRVACEWHAVEHYRAMCAPAFTSLLAHVQQASAEADRMTDAQIDAQHAFWRERFLKHVGPIVPPELPKSEWQ